jgi:hypothetical protein
MSAGAPDLHELQALLYRLITAPDGVAAGLGAEAPPIELDQLITGDARMDALTRAGIYANAYFFRLLEALSEDFPAIVAVIGHERFHNLITGYLLEYPPTEPSLLHLGRYLADYLSLSREFEQWPFLPDLARFERALIDSFHAADAPALDRDIVRSIPPAEWPSMSLRLHPAVRLVRTRWRVDEIARAVAEDRQPAEPAPGENTLIIWRKESQVLNRMAEPAEPAALDLLEPGSDFASICSAIANSVGDEDLANLINRLLARWLSDGLLRG